MKTVEMPKMGDTMEEGKILRWLKQEGEQVKKGESLAEIETDKVNIEVEAFASGVLRKILVPEGTSAPIGARIALVGEPDEPLPTDLDDGEAKKATKEEAKEPAPVPTTGAHKRDGATAEHMKQQEHASPSQERGRIFISPIARRVAEEHQLDYTQIQGTGPNGRIIKMDVEAALATRQAQPSVAPVPAFEAVASADSEAGDREIPLSAMRRTIARRLSQSKVAAPHFYVTSVVDTGKLAALRQQMNEYAAGEPSAVKISYNDLIIRAAARALVRVPAVNVSFAEDRIIQRKQVHIGVAVAIEEGLIVPVVRNADRLGVLDLARETQRLTELARTGKLKPEDFSGGTFTVSNLGMFDVDSFTAIINPPESAILAVGSITPTPAVVDGQIMIRDRMKVTLSSDHRAIDGATAARFLQEFKRLIEEPFGLLL